MAFQTIKRSIGKNNFIKGVQVANNGKRLQFSIARDIAETVNLGTLVQVQQGTGDDAGWLRISASDGFAGFAFTKPHTGVTSRFTLIGDRIGAAITKATTLPHKITDNAVLIDIRPIMVKQS